MRAEGGRPQPVWKEGIEAAEKFLCSPAVRDDQEKCWRQLPALRWNAGLGGNASFKFARSTILKPAIILTINSESPVQLDVAWIGQID